MRLHNIPSKLLYILLTFIFIPSWQLKAQTADEYGEGELPFTGLIFDDEKVEKIPVKPRLLTRDYTAIPSSVILTGYCPEVRSQGQYGTCTSWASSYAARTISEAILNGWTDKAKITREAFAPNFIYTQIKDANDHDCQNGSCIDDALKVMRYRGVPKLYDFDIMCATSIPEWVFTKALSNTIDDYFQVFSIFSDGGKKISATKKSLSENRPVIIGMNVPESFMRSFGSDVWNKTEANNLGGGHAMCVVGYDDNRYGGAFLLMNSWGLNWGNNGYIWVKYKDFGDNVKYGFEMYVKKKEQPKPQPKPEPVYANKFESSMYFRLSTGTDMQPVFTNGVYRMKGEYISGTRYRVYLSNKAPAYVYVIGSDATKAVSTVFPPDEKTSPALVYSSNNIALPDEKWYIEMDDTKGTDYICVLYSAEALDIDKINKTIERGTGTFRQRVTSALGPKCVTDTKFKTDAISFQAASNASVVPVFIEITHK